MWSKESARHSYPQICRKLITWYGLNGGVISNDEAIARAEHWYAGERCRLMDGCKPDPRGFSDHETLKDWWEARQAAHKWQQEEKPVSDVSPTRKSVELYRVRGPGANGEIGVLTTCHEVDEFITGLAGACANMFKGDISDMEYQMLWVLKNALPIAFRLAGYKADTVVERHVLMCGSSAPAADDIVAASERIQSS